MNSEHLNSKHQADYDRVTERLMKSRPSILRFADYLSRHGNWVEIPPFQKRTGEWTARMQQVDGGDLFYWKGDPSEKKMIQVKHRPNLTFTCAGDFPYPDILICAVHTLEHASMDPVGYITLNGPMTHGAFVPYSTLPRWTKRQVKDGTMEHMHQWSYAAPMDCVTFVNLEV